MAGNETTRVIPSDGVLVLLTVVKFIVIVLTFIGNLIIFVVICSSERLRWRTMYIFIASLSLNNAFYASFANAIYYFSWLLKESSVKRTLCHLNPFFFAIFFSASVWHTANIALHRLAAIVYRKWYKQVSKRTFILFVLIGSRVMPLTYIFDITQGSIAETFPVNNSVVCLFKSLRHSTFNIGINIVTPTIIMIASYVHIVFFLRRLQKNEAPQARSYVDIKALSIFGAVSLTFMLGYLPMTVTTIVVIFVEVRRVWILLFALFLDLSLASHPFVYGFMDYEIRKILMEKLCCKQPSKTPSDVRSKTMGTFGVSSYMSSKEEDDPEEQGTSFSDNRPSQGFKRGSAGLQTTDAAAIFTAEEEFIPSLAPENESKPAFSGVKKNVFWWFYPSKQPSVAIRETQL